MEAADQKDPLDLFHPVNWWVSHPNPKDVPPPVGRISSVEVRTVDQPDPAVIFHYDVTNAPNGGEVEAASALHLVDAKALKFSVKTDAPVELGVTLYSFDRYFQYRCNCDTPGQTKEIELPSYGSQVVFKSTPDKAPRLPLTKIVFFVRKAPGAPSLAGTVEISNFQKVTQ